MRVSLSGQPKRINSRPGPLFPREGPRAAAFESSEGVESVMRSALTGDDDLLLRHVEVQPKGLPTHVG